MNCTDWKLHQHTVVTSTNLVAANLPAWAAVRAGTQTMGRGRFQRSWVSDEGGLWLSAVVPASADRVARGFLPLAAGLAICDVLQELGLSSVRLRWPNDVLVNDRKLAGLLIDQFSPSLAVIGIGINVRNQPETHDPALANRTTRLADWMLAPPELPTLTTMLLNRLRQVVNELNSDGVSALIGRVNRLWGAEREVELDLDGRVHRGHFAGVDPEGRLALRDSAGGRAFYDAHEVRHLTET